MHTEQCPKCELRFRTESELKFHLLNDHPDVGEQLADELDRRREWRRHTTRQGPATKDAEQ